MKTMCCGLLVFLFSVTTSLGQQTSGQTDVFYDSGRNVVFATANSNPDYNTQYYYVVRMTTYLTKKGLTQSIGSWGYNGEYGTGSVYVEAPAEAGVEFTALTYYQGVVRYQTYEVVPGCYTCYDWYDAYGFISISRRGDPTQWGPTFSVWVWAAPIIVERILEEVFDLGESGGKKRAPGQAVDFDVAVRSFIPVKWVEGAEVPFTPGGCTGVLYGGDKRTYQRFTFDVRTHSQAILVPDLGSYVGTLYKYTGRTWRYDKTSGLSSGGELLNDSVLHDCYKLDNHGFAPITGMNIVINGNPATRLASARMYGGASNPLVPAPYPSPPIDWDVTVTVSKAVPTSPQYTVQVRHDCYPSHEVFIGTQLIHNWTPTSNSIFYIANCLGGFDQVVSGPNSGPIN